MANYNKALELLFQRPLEPSFAVRDNGKAVLDLPESYYTNRAETIKVNVENRFGDTIETRIPLPELKTKPNLAFAEKLGLKQQFSLFNDRHTEIASQLIKMFMEPKDKMTFTALSAYIMNRVNPFLFQYCFSVAIQHRPDTRDIEVPSIAETFPSNFIEPSVFKDARREATYITNSGDRLHVEIPSNYTASDREAEQRLAYFREDIGVNSHHWHWHLVYPTRGLREIVAKDRRGELFYYMHHQILARYNVERFCNNLAKTNPLNNLREPVKEGYFPKILSSANNRTYPSRISGLTFRDLTREDNPCEIADLERWRDRIIGAIDQGFVLNAAGERIPLDEVRGIDILGDMIEASDLSVNRQFYGSLHNNGHDLIAYSHDPDNSYLEDFGVMGDVTTAMRDPIFYRWHSFIDSIFGKFKTLLQPYDANHLSYQGINVDYIECKIAAAGSSSANVLLTYLQKSDVDLAAGLDFGPNGNIYASYTHLQHAPFEYTFNVTNATGASRQGTCRIFLCPKTDERGTALSLNEQRLMAIEMDKFNVTLMPGQNTIRRRSDESSVTIPFDRSHRRVGTAYQPKAADELARFRFCGCGWPDHMLLPRGKPEGMTFELFVMISNYADDAVQQTSNSPDICGDAYSFCGLKDKLYPDKRTMGFPFDRRLPGSNLKAFTDSFTNMMKTDVKILFRDQIVTK